MRVWLTLLLLPACLSGAGDDEPDDSGTDTDGTTDTDTDGTTDTDTDGTTETDTDTDLPDPLPAGAWRASLRVRTTAGCDLDVVEEGQLSGEACDGCFAYEVEAEAPCGVGFLAPTVRRVVYWQGTGSSDVRLVLDPPGEDTGVEVIGRPVAAPDGEGAFAVVVDGPAGTPEVFARVEGTARFSLTPP